MLMGSSSFFFSPHGCYFRTTLGNRTLKLLSGSCYLPHPDKEETGGEDAHFICSDEQVIGLADGVGGWADVGINAGLFARELMSNSVMAIQEEPKDSIDPAKVLEKAHSSAKAKGSSTACIIALAEKVCCISFSKVVCSSLISRCCNAFTFKSEYKRICRPVISRLLNGYCLTSF